MHSVEELIREAIARGEFDNLKGSGKPLDLNIYFDTPEDMRMAFSILKNAGIQPREIELLNEISNLMDQLKAITDEPGRTALLKTIQKKQLELDLRMENYKHRKG